MSNKLKTFKQKKINLKDTLQHPWVTYPPEYYLNESISEAYKNAMLDAKGKNETSYNGQDYKSTVYEAGISQDKTYHSKYLSH